MCYVNLFTNKEENHTVAVKTSDTYIKNNIH